MAITETLLTVDQGSEFDKTWEWGWQDPDVEGFNLNNVSGWTAKCQIRATPGLTGTIYETDVPVEVGGEDGRFTIIIPTGMSRLWKWKFAFYDIVLTPPVPGEPVRVVEGKIRVRPGVSQ